MMESPLDALDLKPERPKMPLGKVALINFIILLTYIVLLQDDMYLAGKAILIIVHFMLNLLAGVVLIFTRFKLLAQSLLLSAVMILILGFGMCVVSDIVF